MKNKTQLIIACLSCCCFATMLSCSDSDNGTVDLTLEEPEKVEADTTENYTTFNFNHPCAMWSQADFDRVKNALDNGTAAAEVQAEFEALKKNKYALLTYSPSPQKEIVRGDATGTETGYQNYATAMRDAAAAYQTSLLWKLTGDDQYAVKATEILRGWANTCVRITSNDANQVLAAGAQGYTFACAAENMYGYTGWSSKDRALFNEWMINVFASSNRSFLDTHTGDNVCSEHYWSNWDLVNMTSYLAIGILTENSDMVNYVIDYFYSGAGNGCINNLIRGFHTDPLGTGETIAQNQESGRDQGHAQMSAMVAANLCQIAYTLYTQNSSAGKLDFFAANNNAILQLGEYVALSNLKSGTDSKNSTGSWLIAANKMPFNTFEYCQPGCGCKNQSHGAVHTQLADDNGRGSCRPGWEIYYNHYARIKGLSDGFTYVKMFADKIRPEKGAGDTERYGDNSGAFDQLGWATLMLYE